MARDGLFPARAGRLHPRTQVPAFAVSVQALLGCMALWIGASRIDSLLAGIAFGEWAFFALVALAHLQIASRAPTTGSFRAPRWVSAVFGLLALAVALGALWVKPDESLVGVGVLLLGGLVYSVIGSRVRALNEPDESPGGTPRR